jgi:membrane protease subunit HflC
MRRFTGGLLIGALVVVAIVAYMALFVVSQTQQALVLRFGNVVAQIKDPGLYSKWPLIDNVVYFEKRLIDLDSPPLEIIASDQKRLVVDAFGRYRIVDPLRFYQALNNQQIAQQRLAVVLNSAVRRVLGDASFVDLVRDRRAELMGRITEQVDREAEGLGVEVVDVRIRSADLPTANSQAIYQRMQTERQRQATEIRATGEQAARQIRAEADRTATVIVAEANGESERLRGEGEAERNNILADAFDRDPDFFAFYRTLQAYQQSMGSDDTKLVLSPNSDFFRFFNNPAGGAAAPAIAAPPAATPGQP